MAQKVSAEEREQIVAAFDEGLSCKQIAKDFGRSPDTISRIARAEGHTFGLTNLANAHEARRAYGAERRANIRLTTAGLLEQTLGEFNDPTLVYNFGGKDNTYNEALLDKPDARTKRDLAQTAATLWRIIKEIDAAEETRREPSRLEVIFTQLDQIADDYERGTVEPQTGVDDQPVDGPSEPV